jgi:hypothetical protein
MIGEEWTNNECVARYLNRADGFPHRAEGERVLLEHVPPNQSAPLANGQLVPIGRAVDGDGGRRVTQLAQVSFCLVSLCPQL